MLQFGIAYLAAACAFLGADVLWLNRVMGFYRHSLGDLLADKQNLAAAAALPDLLRRHRGVRCSSCDQERWMDGSGAARRPAWVGRLRDLRSDQSCNASPMVHDRCGRRSVLGNLCHGPGIVGGLFCGQDNGSSRMRPIDRTNGVVSRRRANESGSFSIREGAMPERATVESPSKRLEHLLGLIAAGNDQSAFAELYAATRRKLFSTVLLIIGQPDLAEELLQEAFVRIWSNASAYRSERGTAMTWMIVIVRNMAIDHARRPAREAHSDERALMQLPVTIRTRLKRSRPLRTNRRRYTKST